MSFTVEDVQEASKKLELERKICGKKIIFVEGPAGAGKTSLLSKLLDIPEISVVSRGLGKRQFQVKEAGVKSFLNDTTKIQEALTLESSVIFIDRCFGSQRVYHAIRTDREIEYHPQLWSLAKNLVDTLEADLAWRLQREPRSVEVYWLFLIPQAPALVCHRNKTLKSYPHSHQMEIYHYKKLSHHLVLFGLPVLRPAYDNTEDRDFIVRGFREWMHCYPHIDFATLWKTFALLKKINLEEENS